MVIELHLVRAIYRTLLTTARSRVWIYLATEIALKCTQIRNIEIDRGGYTVMKSDVEMTY